MTRRILVAMSGGVDSSVAAALLVEQGYDVVGATMKTFCYSEKAGPSKTCCGLDGIMDAQRVAQTLGIPHYVFDVEEAFTRDVIDDFVGEYANGRTPTSLSASRPLTESQYSPAGTPCRVNCRSLAKVRTGPMVRTSDDRSGVVFTWVLGIRET